MSVELGGGWNDPQGLNCFSVRTDGAAGRGGDMGEMDTVAAQQLPRQPAHSPLTVGLCGLLVWAALWKTCNADTPGTTWVASSGPMWPRVSVPTSVWAWEPHWHQSLRIF